MAILRITRFSADPAQEEELLAKRASLIAATRKAQSGLVDTRLAKADDGTWIDVWQWESDADFEKAVTWAHSAPEAMAAFALVGDATAEKGTLVA